MQVFIYLFIYLFILFIYLFIYLLYYFPEYPFCLLGHIYRTWYRSVLIVRKMDLKSSN